MQLLEDLEHREAQALDLVGDRDHRVGVVLDLVGVVAPRDPAAARRTRAPAAGSTPARSRMYSARPTPCSGSPSWRFFLKCAYSTMICASPSDFSVSNAAMRVLRLRSVCSLRHVLYAEAGQRDDHADDRDDVDLDLPPDERAVEAEHRQLRRPRRARRPAAAAGAGSGGGGGGASGTGDHGRGSERMGRRLARRPSTIGADCTPRRAVATERQPRGWCCACSCFSRSRATCV